MLPAMRLAATLRDGSAPSVRARPGAAEPGAAHRIEWRWGYGTGARYRVCDATDNRGWMAYPAGGTARFTAFGQTLSVAIPDSLIMPGSVRPDLTIEARIYPRAWKAYGVANGPVVSLRQEWDNSLELRDGKWNSPAAPLAAAGNVIAANSAAWSSACTLGTWHLLKLTLSSSGSIQCRLDGNLVGTANAATFSGNRTNAWIFTLGNFDGDLDEVRISNVVR